MTAGWGPGGDGEMNRNIIHALMIIYYYYLLSMLERNDMEPLTTCCLSFHNSAEDKVRQQHAAHYGEHLNSPLLHSPPSTGQASSGSSPQSGRHCQRQDTADIRSVLVNNSLHKTNTYDVN